MESSEIDLGNAPFTEQDVFLSPSKSLSHISTVGELKCMEISVHCNILVCHKHTHRGATERPPMVSPTCSMATKPDLTRFHKIQDSSAEISQIWAPPS